MTTIEAFEDIYTDAEPAERRVLVGVGLFGVLVAVGVVLGVLKLAYLFSVFALAGMYALLTMGLNVQWGYAGLINFSVAAFWGVGAYSAALLTASRSPLGLELHPVVGFLAAILVSGALAVLIGIPTLRLREDYLAIASLGLAEVVRLILLNEREYTNGSRGISGMPRLFEWLPFSQNFVNFLVVAGIILITYAILRRMHHSPWGRALRTVRADEDLAKALGKDTYRLKMQAFVLGSVVMAIAGAFYVHVNLYLDPSDLLPIQTFYIWIAVILGGTGSDRGAVLGGLTVIAILEGTRFVNDVALFQGLDLAPLRLLFVGVLIVLVIRFRSSGLLPPRRELIWPAARDSGGERE